MADTNHGMRTRAARSSPPHVRPEGATLPILHDLQAAFGCIPTEAVPLVASALNLTPRRGARGRHFLSRIPPPSARPAHPAPLPCRSLPVARRRSGGGSCARAAGRRLARDHTQTAR